MRPKSIATVVVSLTRSASDVILRSVDTTSISLTDWMKCVLPALKGPVTTILTVCIGDPRLERAYTLDQAIDQRGLLFLVHRLELLDLGGERHALRADDLNQTRLQQAVDDTAHIQVAHPRGSGDLADGVLRIDIGDDLPLFDIQVDIADVGAGPVDEVEGHVEVGDLLLKLFPLTGSARAFDDDVFQVEADADSILRRKHIGVEAKETVQPGEQLVDDVQDVLADAVEDILLAHVAGVDEHQAQLFVAFAGGMSLDGPQLARVDQAALEKDARERAVLFADMGEDQLAFAEGNPRGFGLAFQGERPGLAGEVDQVEELSDVEVT